MNALTSVERPARIVVRDVAIIDASGREPEGRQDVLVEDGRIRSIGSPGGNLPADVATIDGAGCTLLPGLGAFMVPTLQTMEFFLAHRDLLDVPAEKVALAEGITARAYQSIRIAHDAGVKLGSGSDVVGPWQGRRGEELVYKARVLGAHGAILSATRINAELFGLDAEIGTIEAGKRADLLLAKGQPLDDITLLAAPENVTLVMRAGVVAKDLEGRLG